MLLNYLVFILTIKYMLCFLAFSGDAVKIQKSICPESLELTHAEKTIRINPNSHDARKITEEALNLLPGIINSKHSFKLDKILSAAIKYDHEELYILRFVIHETTCLISRFVTKCEKNPPPERIEYECCIQIEYLPWIYKLGSIIEHECQMLK